MLSLTHAARQLISGMLTDAPAGTVLRISATGEAVEICKDRVRNGDTTFNDGSKCVLAVDQMMLRKLAGRTIDVATVSGKSALILADTPDTEQSPPC